MNKIVLEQNSEKTEEEVNWEENDLDSDNEDSVWCMDTRGVSSQAISNNKSNETTNSELDKNMTDDVVQEDDEVLCEEERIDEQLADDDTTE